jgi:hypothetical protein
MFVEVIAAGVALPIVADILKWCFRAAAAAERESRRHAVRAEREHRRQIEREARRTLREEAYRRRGKWLDMLTETMEHIWQMRKDTRALIPKFTQIVTANRKLLRDTPLTEQQRKAIRDCIFQIEKGIARLRSYSGPYLQQYVDQVSAAKRAALENDFEEPEAPEPMLPADFPVVGDRLGLDEDEIGAASTGGCIDLGFGQRGLVIGTPSPDSLAHGVVISDYDIDRGVWRLSSALGRLCQGGGAVEAMIVERVAGGYRLVWHAPSQEAVDLFLPYGLATADLKDAPWGTRVRVYVHEDDYRMRRIAVGTSPPERSDDAGLSLAVLAFDPAAAELIARLRDESPVTFWRRPGLAGDPRDNPDAVLRFGSGEEFPVYKEPGANHLRLGEQVAPRLGTVDCPLYRSAVELRPLDVDEDTDHLPLVQVDAFLANVERRIVEQEELIAVFREGKLETRRYQLLLEAELEAGRQASQFEAPFSTASASLNDHKADEEGRATGKHLRFHLEGGAALPSEVKGYAVEVRFGSELQDERPAVCGWLTGADPGGAWLECRFYGDQRDRLPQTHEASAGTLRLTRVDPDVRRQVRALEQFRSASVLQGKSGEDREAFRRLRRVLLGLPQPGPVAPLNFTDEIGQAQDRAIRLMVAGGPLTLVQGPPGTGKTETIARGIAAFLTDFPEARIAMVSETNQAVKEALRKLKRILPGCNIVWHPSEEQKKREAADGGDRDISFDARLAEFVDRLGATAPDLPTWGNAARKALLRASSEPGFLRRRIAPALLGGVSVYGATLSMLGRISVGMPLFDLVIVDEAAKASLPLCMIAAMCSKRLALVGDHNQLLPYLDERILERAGPDREARREVEDLWENSLFRRMWEHASDGCKVFLSRQYRCRPAIAHAVSRLFYGGRVQNGKANDSELTPWEPSLVWMNTFGDGQQSKGGSIFNLEEANLLMELLAELGDILPAPERTSMAVVAAYRAQGALLRKLLAESGLRSRFLACDVRTVDSTQGGQWDVVLLALSRCRGSSRFLGNSNRLNVALSRARELAVIVGSIQYALTRRSTESALGRLARYCERHNGRGVRICYPNLQGGVGHSFRRMVSGPILRGQS